MAGRSTGPFGALLRQFRMAALLTQEQLAGRAQLSPDTIRALESGKRRRPRLDSARLLADALALSGVEREALLAAATPTSDRHTDDQGGLVTRVAPDAVQPSPLLGRERELQSIHMRLVGDGSANSERAHLLTLTGPAGVGKTRLALAAATQFAEHFPDGVVLVDLSPVRDHHLVLPVVARSVGLADVGSRPLLERLCEFLNERSMLVVLDNFEQVLPAASALPDLLSRCPGLVLLVTSRVPLRLRWEWTVRIPPLPVPDMNAPLPPLVELERIPAVALFLTRARAQRSDFALTAEQAPLAARLASELDGLPLALELAAARLDVLSLPVLTHRLSNRLRFLRWDAADLPDRQRSLEAAIGWSYDLLSAQEQQVFRCLGVFAGRVAPPAIAAVSTATAVPAARAHTGPEAADATSEDQTLEWLASLAEKSLVLATPSKAANDPTGHTAEAHVARAAPDEDESEPSFTMLETVRAYAWEQLERVGTLERACRAHAHYFLDLAQRADSHLRGASQRAWFVRLESDHHNLRAALRWLLSREGAEAASEHATGLQLAVSLGWFWWTRGYLVEGANWLAEALDRAPQADMAVRAHALRQMGAMLAYQGAFDRAKQVLEEALEVAQRCPDPAEIAQGFAYQGLCAVYAGDTGAGIPLLQEALRRGRELAEPHLLGMTLMFFGAATLAQGDDDQARSIYAESLEQFETAGDALFAASLRLNLGWFAWRHGELLTAVRDARAGIEVGVAYQDRRLVGFGAQTVLALLAGSGDAEHEHVLGEPLTCADLAQQARLQGAIDALNQTTGMTLMQRVVHKTLTGLRERITREELEDVYREGRFLPLSDVARLALTLVDELQQTLSDCVSATGPTPTQSTRAQASAPPTPPDSDDARSHLVNM